MDLDFDSGKIIKIVTGVVALILLIIFIVLLIPNKDKKTYQVQSVMLDKKNLTLSKGSSYNLKVIISPSNATNQNVSYMSNNTYVATVDANGYVQAYNAGEAKITVLSSNGKQDQCVVTVVEETIPVNSIILDHDDVTLIEGESITLNAIVTPSNTTEHNYTWTSSDPSVASVINGRVTALKTGSTLITVMTESRKLAICDIEVREKVTGISIDIKEKTISKGDELKLTAKLEPIGSAANVEWISSNNSVAAVDSNGNVKAIGVGEVVITAKAGSLSASTKIKVKIVSTSDIYTFKYVENQMDKPLIGCHTYTEADKVRLEGQLEEAIKRVGYGTRAGVVEAARFLVGGLDYRIKYVGPKKPEVDPTRQLGIYREKGLNIAKKNNDGWGCSVSGWTQGMDCTNFVVWAFKQNGMSVDYYSTANTYCSTEVVNQIRPGDFMLTPSSGYCGKGKDFSHIGIVIGVTDDKIYVAESTTGSINSIVITVVDKNNMPTKYKFATTRLHNYASDGKLTDMWD